MRRYLLNLLTALRGINPFERELEQVKKDYERVAEQVAQLQSVYATVKKRTTGAVSQIRGLQKLVENLRSRLSEKDELIERMKQDFQQRVNAYNAKIDELTKVKQ